MKSQWQDDLETLYQQTRLELPTVELDQRIRHVARKSIHKKNHNLKWYLSTAAVVLLSVNIVLFTFDLEPEIIEIRTQQVYPPASSPQSNLNDQVDRLAEQAVPPEAEGIGTPIDSLEPPAQSQRFVMKKTLRESETADKNMPSAAPYELEQGQAAARALPAAPIIQLPESLPFDINRLMAGHEGLTGQQSVDSLSIYKAGELILSMTQQQQGIAVQAYQGAELWGVNANWGHSVDINQQCKKEEYLICSLTGKVQGGFKDNQLFFIRWVQNNGF